jgi:Tfp pilus assembly protein FimT
MSLVEMLTVIVMIGLMVAIVVPRLRVSPLTHARNAADQLVRDLEQARVRALATRSLVRVVFDPTTNSYTGYLDFDRDSVLALSTAETDSLRGFGRRTLTDGVVIGRGSVPDVPAMPGPGNITFTGNQIDFDSRGLTAPFGTRGVVYFIHQTNRSAVAAVTVTSGAGIRSWVYDGNGWR